LIIKLINNFSVAFQMSFFKKNIVLVVMIPAIIGSHLAWGALQNDTRFVSPDEKKGQPILEIAQKVKKYLTNKSDSSK